MVSQKQSNVNALWDVYIQPTLAIAVSQGSGRAFIIINIGVGLSALLVSTNRAMRDLYIVERVTGSAPRFFMHVCKCDTTVV